MRVLAEVRERLRALLQRGREERELDEEFRFHVEMETEANIGLGKGPEQARREAFLTFGGIERFKEEVRDARGTRPLEDLAKDVRYALRTLRRNPGFTLSAVLTLALGIGANTAIFSVVDAALLRPLPYREPERLVTVGWRRPSEGRALYKVRYARYGEWAERSRTLESVGAYTLQSFNVTGGEQPVRVNALSVTSTLLVTLGVDPYLGRGFLASADPPGSARRVMLGYGFWQRNFGGGPGVIGRTVELNDIAFEVIGVLPRDFAFPMPRRVDGGWFDWAPELWVPSGLLGEGALAEGRFTVIGRRAPGRSLEQVRAELSTISADAVPVRMDDRIGVAALREQAVGPLRPALLVFLGAVGLVLLTACVNLGGLLLARLTARARELAVRASLGASRRRIVRQLLTESVVLAMLGGGVGALLAWGGLELLIAAAPGDIPRVHEAALDGRVFAFTLVLSVATGLVFGLLPTLRASRADLRSTIAAGGPGMVAERSTRRTHGVLVAVEVALAVALLVGAGLLIRSFTRLTHVDPGFDTEHLLTLELQLPSTRYPDRVDVGRFYERLGVRLEALPGISAASAIDRLPFGMSTSRIRFQVVGRPELPPDQAPRALNNTALPGYFEAMGIPLLRGRSFDGRDVEDASPVIVISRSLARRTWPEGNPVGERIDVFGRVREVVGVVGDVRHVGPAVAPQSAIYFPHAQDVTTRRRMTLVLRTGVDPADIVAAVRGEIRRLDPRLPISDVRAFGSLSSLRTSSERFNAMLVGVFAAMALALSAVGIYGVVSFTVARRARDIALRAAIGASTGAILGAVLKRVLAMVGIGAAIGIAASVPLARLARGLLFGVGPGDPLTFAAVGVLLALVGLIAAWVPARRAMRVDPMVVLRAE